MMFGVLSPKENSSTAHKAEINCFFNLFYPGNFIPSALLSSILMLTSEEFLVLHLMKYITFSTRVIFCALMCIFSELQLVTEHQEGKGSYDPVFPLWSPASRWKPAGGEAGAFLSYSQLSLVGKLVMAGGKTGRQGKACSPKFGYH